DDSKLLFNLFTPASGVPFDLLNLLLSDFGCKHVSRVQPTQSHQCPTMRFKFQEPVAHTSPGRLVHHDLCLLDDTLALLLSQQLSLAVLIAPAGEFFFRQWLADA